MIITTNASKVKYFRPFFEQIQHFSPPPSVLYLVSESSGYCKCSYVASTTFVSDIAISNLGCDTRFPRCHQCIPCTFAQSYNAICLCQIYVTHLSYLDFFRADKANIHVYFEKRNFFQNKRECERVHDFVSARARSECRRVAAGLQEKTLSQEKKTAETLSNLCRIILIL